MDLLLIFLALVLFHSQHPVNGAVKTWVKDRVQPWGQQTGSGSAPSTDCKQSKAIFKKEIDGFLYMDNQHSLQEVVLPTDGAVVISPNSEVQFTDSKKCDSASDDVNLLSTSKRLWFSTKSWSAEGEGKNVAKPHVFQIPCECDIVEFPSENVYAVDLQLVDEIVVDKILINDRMDNFEQFLETPIGQKMFLNSEAVHFTPGLCHPQKYCGCHNPNRFEKFKDLLCEEEGKYCQEPHCLEPIQPDGHCCKMCGAMLNFKIEDTCDFNITNMSEVGRKLKRFRNGKFVNKLHYFAGMVPGKTARENFVQLVIAEVDDYTGISVEFMDYLTKDEHFQVDELRIKFTSGIPYVRGQSSAFLIMVLTLVFVLSVFAMIYVHYEREPKYENWIPISRLTMLRRSVAFARFENRPNAGDGQNTVNLDMRYENDDDDDDGADPIEQKSLNGFNNPMYQRKRDPEPVVLGTVETEMLQPATSTAPSVDVADEADTFVGGIKLVDISLNDK